MPTKQSIQPLRIEEYNWDSENNVNVEDSKQVFYDLSRRLSGESKQQQTPADARRPSLGISEATVNEENEEVSEEKDFDLKTFIEGDRKRYTEAGKTHKPHLGLTWKDLTVRKICILCFKLMKYRLKVPEVDPPSSKPFQRLSCQHLVLMLIISLLVTFLN